MRALTAACALSFPLFASAAVRVDVTPNAGACGPATLIVTPVCATGDCPGPIRTSAGAEIDLAAAEEWIVTATSRNCWAPSLNVRRDAKAVAVPLWPQTTLTGKLVIPKGAEVPSSVALQIESPPQQPTGGVPQSQLTCPVSKNTFRCAGPSATLDVRISAIGFAPRYLWAVDQPNLGDIVLARGGSISGTVRFDGDGPPLTEVALELKVTTPPIMSEGWSHEEKRIASQSATARPNARGFFQFAQVEAGQYSVIARHEGWSRARHAGIEVKEGEESALAQPLLIEPLAEVDVVIQPPLDPYGKPWQVELMEMVPLSTMSTPIVETEASMTGLWSAAGIESGYHKISVKDHRGSHFTYQVVDVSPRMPPVTITMSNVLVRGTLRIGDKPARARFEFRNGRGTNVAMRSDAEGRFSGALPTDGRWEIDVVRGRAPTFHRRRVEVRAENGVAEIDLRLPDTRLAGKVVSTKGEPVTAFVRLWSAERDFLGSTSTDEHGVFEVIGIEPGTIYLEAESRDTRDWKSGYLPVAVSTTPADDLTVVLRRALWLKGRLVTPSGLPVAGAIVRYVLPDRPRETMEDVSGPNGRFQIPFSPGTTAVDLAIVPPALPVKIARIPLEEGPARTTEIVLAPSGGTLEIEMDHPTPSEPGSHVWIEHRGAVQHVLALRRPVNWTTVPRGFHAWGSSIELEPGEYAVCGDRVKRDRCVRKLIAPGGIERVNGRALTE